MEKTQPTVVEEEKKLNYPKEKLLNVMSEVLLDSVDHLIQYSTQCKELNQQGPEKVAAEIEELSEKLHNSLLLLEQDICAVRGIDIEKYYEDVTLYDTKGDTEVKACLDRLGQLIETALKGEKIVVKFDIVPELTKEMTLRQYKLILTSHLHLFYTAIQNKLKENPKATAEELQVVIDNEDSHKIKRRYTLVFDFIEISCSKKRKLARSQIKTTDMS
jgi:hypothetical protein